MVAILRKGRRPARSSLPLLFGTEVHLGVQIDRWAFSTTMV